MLPGDARDLARTLSIALNLTDVEVRTDGDDGENYFVDVVPADGQSCRLRLHLDDTRRAVATRATRALVAHFR
jgi:hypothetical protein